MRHDRDRNRLAEIHERLRRAGTRNVQVHEPGSPRLADLAGKMDCVLVDAPCTGSGTWRRRPDAKWRLARPALEARLAEQDAALSGAAPYVRPGGRLAYVTCSMFAEENSLRLDSFLARRGEFSARPFGDELAVLCPPSQRIDCGSGRVMFTPKSTATDGFFIAVMEKRN